MVGRGGRRSREGSGRSKLAPGAQGTQGVSERGPSRSRPWLAVTVPETAGVRRISRRVAEGSSREGHASVTGLASRHGERGKSTLPCVLDNSQISAAWIWAPIGG